MTKKIISRVVKGRLMIPKEIRPDDDCMVMSRMGLSGIKLFTVANWESFCEKIDGAEDEQQARAFKRLLFGMSETVEVKRGGIKLGKAFSEIIADGDVIITCDDGAYTVENIFPEDERKTEIDSNS
ncbi:MAG: hypothetical protein IJZ20_04250 [Clostridia bacterium]|nr:hypothetical protein [Clostridia bacterium]